MSRVMLYNSTAQFIGWPGLGIVNWLRNDVFVLVG
jgi:hypothetical protein